MPGGPRKGTGGHGRRRLSGKGPTPPAERRPGHPAARRAARASAPPERSGQRRQRRSDDAAELVVGRNPVVEALRARVPGEQLLIATGLPGDERTEQARRLAERRGVPVLDVSRNDLDRRTGDASHQGIALVVPPYSYRHPDELLSDNAAEPPLLVALDGVTDPRNLGSVVRSAAAFGASGVVVPERRAAGVTAAAWKASAGMLARLPVARATNLVRTLQDYSKAGLFVVGLAADADLTLDELEMAIDPLVLVVGSEGRGLSRLVGETCDLRVSIPMANRVESLNAGVAAGVALAEIARRRRGERGQISSE